MHLTQYQFKDPTLRVNALTHTSCANEMKSQNLKSNQRLEFLGDAVLSLVVCEFLYANYPHLNEGDMTKVRAYAVCEDALAQWGKQTNLGQMLYLGKGEDQTGGREKNSMVSDTVEAMLGAIYLDGGYEIVKDIILKELAQRIAKGLECMGSKDYKTSLQEFVQKKPGSHIGYETIDQSGPDHQRVYTVKVSVNSECMGSGKGNSKKEAEQQAARQALKTLQAL